MLSPQAFVRGLVSRALPPVNPDSQAIDAAVRLGRYSEMDIVGRPATKTGYLEEGSYWVSRTPTPGTGVAYGIVTSFLDTTPAFYLYNTDTVKNVYLDYLKIVVTVAGASGTIFQFAAKLDAGQRFPSTQHMTQAIPNANNMANGNNSILQVYYQSSATASVIPAASGAARVVAEGTLGGITIVGDELCIEFGKTDQSASYVATAVQATFPGRKVTSSPPVIIAPQTNAVIYLWTPTVSITGLSYSFELGHVER